MSFKKLSALAILLISGAVSLAQSQALSINATQTKGCQPFLSEFTIEGVDQEITWEFSNGDIVVGQKALMKFSEAGVYSVVATFEVDGKEVTVKDERLVEVYPNPVPSVEMVETAELGKTLYTIPTIGNSYQWFLSNGEALDFTSYQVPVKDLKPGGYSLVLEETNSLGCSQRTAPIEVEVLASM